MDAINNVNNLKQHRQFVHFYHVDCLISDMRARYVIVPIVRNTSVEQYYTYDSVSKLDGYYYLNTFDDILASGGETSLRAYCRRLCL